LEDEASLVQVDAATLSRPDCGPSVRPTPL